jgi:hypothetical protein
MRAPLITAAAVALVAAATLLTLSGVGPVAPLLETGAPAAVPATRYLLEPLPADELPPPGGGASTDEAMARCATAAVRGGRAAEYPPTAGWRATNHMGTGAVQSELTIDNSFACLVTPASVTLSGTAGTPVGDLQLVRMSPDELVVLNPKGRHYTIGYGDKRLVEDARVEFVQIDGRAPIGDLRLTVGRHDGPVPDPVPGLTVIDRDLPDRTYTADGAQLANCLGKGAGGIYGDLALWAPVGRHDGGDTGPAALVARIGDLSAGYCVFDALDGPTFTGAPMKPVGERAEPLDYYRGGGTALLLTAPPDLTRMVVAPASDPADQHDCTLMDGLAMCTLAASGPPEDNGSHSIVVTAFSPTHPQGDEVYGN